MPRSISLANTPAVLSATVLLVLWAAWCVFVVHNLVPLVERHVVVYYGVSAWIMCMLPVLAAAIFIVVRAAKSDG